jgi:amino acid adenylation domain-containing protein
MEQAPKIGPAMQEKVFVFPLSFSQQRLWFLDQYYEEGSSVYNIPSAIRLRGALDVSALERSLQEIVNRHEALRTTFSVLEGEAVQVIAPALKLSLPVVDLSETPEAEREEEAQRLAKEESRRRFDLSQGPLVRIRLLQLGKEDHVLLMTLHHIVSDAWSIGVMHHELSVLYQAFSNSKPSPLPDLPIQYADYAVWQREWLKGEELERQLSYWKKQLEGIPAVLDLPTDRPRSPVQSHRGGRQSFGLSKDLTEQLKAISRKEGVTLFMTLLATFQTLLHRYSGQEDIVVGSPIAGRNRSEIEGIIGFFVNTLALRSNLSDNPTFTQLLARVKEVALGAYAHQELPFEKLVEELHPERDLSYSPLFQVMFVLQNTSGTALKLGRIAVSSMRVGGGTAKFDLSLSMSEAPDGLKATLEYNTDLFDVATITRMVGHLQVLLDGIVADPEQRISELPLLTKAEKHQLLVDWNDTKRDYSKDKCIHELFEEQAEKTPYAIALVFEDQQLTYRELNNRANRLAHYLQKLGVVPDTLVGVFVERSIEMVVGLLGILKAGGAYLPIDPDFPRARVEFILEDSRATFLLTQAQLGELIPSFGGKRITIDRDWQEIARESAANAGQQQYPDNLAYVTYTSGSTGKPKGVMIQHGSVVNFLASMAREPGLTETDIFLAVTTLSFDIAGLEIYLPLTVGARVVLVRREVAADDIRLAQQLSNCGATVMQATPATWHMLLAGGWQGSRELKILCGGEALLVDLAKQLVYRCASLWNMYGPTETTIWSAVRRLPLNFSRVTLGRPIANTQFYILDRHLQPVPVGVTGELHIGGLGLARGYLNRPELTREKFIANPFSAEPTSRLYKTGDLARYLPDGNIEFLGRIDNQVKIRGFRIELGEIESILAQHPAIQQAVVIAREDTPGDKRLVSYIVTANGSAISAHDLRSYLQHKLPDYMVPSAFVFLDSVPLTPNGKVDHNLLPSHERCRPDLKEIYVAPRNSTENKIATIWREALGIDKIGIYDNFFDFGGHSLLALKILKQLGEFYKLDFKTRWLFESPTVAQLAERLRKSNFSRSDKNSTWSHLVELQLNEGNRPVFFVPGGAGGEEDLLRCAPLLRRIGSRYSIYGLLSLNVRGVGSVEKIAKEYLNEVRAVQPEGPYFLIGECLSGMVAYEMAQQLFARGHSVALLALLDHARVTRRRYFNFQRDYYLERLTFHWNHLQQFDLWKRLIYPLIAAKKAFSAKFSLGRNRIKKNKQEGSTSGYGYDTARLRYRPRKYHARMTLILSETIYDRQPDGGWANLVRAGLDVYKVNAPHNTYLTDHVDYTAAQLRECLAKAERDTCNQVAVAGGQVCPSLLHLHGWSNSEHGES